MKDADSQPKRRNSRTDSPELRLAGIHHNVGPDAEDRLRRIFAILLRHAAKGRQIAPKESSPPDNKPSEDHVGEQA